MSRSRYIQVLAVAVCIAMTVCCCKPVEIPTPSTPIGGGGISIPSDSTSSGGKDHIDKDSLSSGGGKPITLPGFANPTPKPTFPIRPNRPEQSSPPSEIDNNLLGAWSGVAYATELRGENSVQRLDSVRVVAPESLLLQIEDDSFSINHIVNSKEYDVEGVWESIDNRLFLVYDSPSGWSETYMFDVSHNDDSALVLELPEPQIAGDTLPVKIRILWFERSLP